MSEPSMEKPIAEQMLDWAERLDKRFYLFNKESLYNWLIIKASRVAHLEKENVALKREKEGLMKYVPKHVLKEWEYYSALIANTKEKYDETE